jgi:DNA-binding transcriptional regulator LsrR (DeoR family)
VDALVVGYKHGKTMKELAAEFGINRVTVSAQLRRANVPLRQAGFRLEHTAEAAVLYEAGWSSGRLAERYDVGADTVLKVLRRAGVAVRPRRGGPRPSRPQPDDHTGRPV